MAKKRKIVLTEAELSALTAKSESLLSDLIKGAGVTDIEELKKHYGKSPLTSRKEYQAEIDRLVKIISENMAIFGEAQILVPKVDDPKYAKFLEKLQEIDNDFQNK